ncbi:MAG: Transcriptional regulator, MerR family, partial [uncultured Thermomicrobiales bacterium]
GHQGPPTNRHSRRSPHRRSGPLGRGLAGDVAGLGAGAFDPAPPDRRGTSPLHGGRCRAAAPDRSPPADGRTQHRRHPARDRAGRWRGSSPGHQRRPRAAFAGLALGARVVVGDGGGEGWAIGLVRQRGRAGPVPDLGRQPVQVGRRLRDDGAGLEPDPQDRPAWPAPPAGSAALRGGRRVGRDRGSDRPRRGAGSAADRDSPRRRQRGRLRPPRRRVHLRPGRAPPVPDRRAGRLPAGSGRLPLLPQHPSPPLVERRRRIGDGTLDQRAGGRIGPGPRSDRGPAPHRGPRRCHRGGPGM